jgi:succinyl-CoA synthetase alpha subunit
MLKYELLGIISGVGVGVGIAVGIGGKSILHKEAKKKKFST